jgi:hypothetical protein
MCVLDLGEVRMAFLELARRGVQVGLFAEPADVMMLLADELDAYLADPASFTPVIAERLETFRDLYDIDPPFVLTTDPPPLAEWPRRSRSQPDGSAPAAAETILTGLGGSPGSYTGRSRIITSLDQAGKIEPGDVLVAPFTDVVDTAVPRRRCGRGRPRRDQQPRHGGGPRTRYPLRRVGAGRHLADPGRRPGHRERDRGNPHRHGAKRGRQARDVVTPAAAGQPQFDVVVLGSGPAGTLTHQQAGRRPARTPPWSAARR